MFLEKISSNLFLHLSIHMPLCQDNYHYEKYCTDGKSNPENFSVHKNYKFQELPARFQNYQLLTVILSLVQTAIAFFVCKTLHRLQAESIDWTNTQIRKQVTRNTQWLQVLSDWSGSGTLTPWHSQYGKTIDAVSRTATKLILILWEYFTWSFDWI